VGDYTCFNRPYFLASCIHKSCFVETMKFRIIYTSQTMDNIQHKGDCNVNRHIVLVWRTNQCHRSSDNYWIDCVIIHHMQGVNTETLLTVLPVRSSFLTLGHLGVQITDALYLSEPGSLQKLSLFLCNQTQMTHKNTYPPLSCPKRRVYSGFILCVIVFMSVLYLSNYPYVYFCVPITVVVRSEAWNVFAGSNIGILGSNPTQGLDVCVYSVFVLSSGFATGWSPV
jgi:hypothetical protein